MYICTTVLYKHMKSFKINGDYGNYIQQYACAKKFKARGIFGIAHIANEGRQYDSAKGQCMLNFKFKYTL